MTIKEIKGILETSIAMQHGYLTDRGIQALELLDRLRAKESELKGALIIPEGWELLNARVEKKFYVVALCYNDCESVIGRGKKYHEALRNALEQINEGN